MNKISKKKKKFKEIGALSTSYFFAPSRVTLFDAYTLF